MRHALLLNASWEPLCVVPLRRAVVLVLTEKADIVAEADGTVRSVSTSVPTPSVIRLRRYVRVPYRGRLPLTRRNVMVRDEDRCAYCDGRASTVDHVVPRSRGGANSWENVVAACGPCNHRKGSKLLSELGWSLRREPFAPHGTRWVLIGLAQRDPTWAPYLPGVPAAEVEAAAAV